MFLVVLFAVTKKDFKRYKLRFVNTSKDFVIWYYIPLSCLVLAFPVLNVAQQKKKTKTFC